MPDCVQLAHGPIHTDPAACSRLFVMRAVLTELSVRKMPSFIVLMSQRSNVTLIRNVVPPFCRRALPALRMMQLLTFSVEAALIWKNLSWPSKPSMFLTVTVPEDLIVIASSPTLSHVMLSSVPPL